MKRKLYLTIILPLLAAALFGCGKKRAVSGEELAAALCRDVPFAETLTEIDNTASSKQLFLNPNEYSKITMYVSSSSSCDEFAIIETANTGGAAEKIADYIEKKRAAYLSYRPAEAEKLDNAYVAEYRNAVVMVVCSDKAAAETAFRNYLKE